MWMQQVSRELEQLDQFRPHGKSTLRFNHIWCSPLKHLPAKHHKTLQIDGQTNHTCAIVFLKYQSQNEPKIWNFYIKSQFVNMINVADTEPIFSVYVFCSHFCGQDKLSSVVWPLTTGYWLLATGYWLLATGSVVVSQLAGGFLLGPLLYSIRLYRKHLSANAETALLACLLDVLWDLMRWCGSFTMCSANRHLQRVSIEPVTFSGTLKPCLLTRFVQGKGPNNKTFKKSRKGLVTGSEEEQACLLFAMAQIRRIGHDPQAPFCILWFFLDIQL